jgi:zinc/manganese transport system permease protein
MSALDTLGSLGGPGSGLVGLRSAFAGALALAFGGAPLGTLLIARRMSLMGDALSHGVLLGAAAAVLLAGRDPIALTLGAVAAALLVTAVASLVARTRRLPEDAAFAAVYLPALAAGVVLASHKGGPEALEAMLFGAAGALDHGALVLAASVASVTLIALALFIRGFVAESVDPGSARVARRGVALHLLFMSLVALNLVAGFRAFGALMTVAMIVIPAAAARFWARGWAGQAAVAIGLSAAASTAGLALAAPFRVEPGAAMTLCAAGLFALSGLGGANGGLLTSLAGRKRLASRAPLA